jgi:hypothetical protein
MSHAFKSHRLQVLIPPELDTQVQKAAERSRVSKGEWVRRSLEQSLRMAVQTKTADPIARLSALEGPTGDIGQILKEIEQGRG